jgi:serpin B
VKTPLALSILLALSLPAAANPAGSLGLDLFKLRAGQPGNFLISPYSIEAALSMALGGAAGTTQEEMAKVLHLDQPDMAGKNFTERQAALQEAVRHSEQRVEQQQGDGGKIQSVQFAVANRLFGNAEVKFEPDFLAQTLAEWAAPLDVISFTQPEEARTKINSWVQQQTQDRIKDLIPQDGVTSKTGLVIVNALYFKAAWNQDFNPTLTADLPFSVDSTTAVPVPTMFQTNHFGYLKQPGFTAVTVPYFGKGFQMLIILPDAKDGLAAVTQTLTPSVINQLAAAPTETEVKLYLPKFKIEPSSISLASDLKTLGMNAAFDQPPGSADFTRMAKRSADFNVGISDVFHKTFIAIDEEGTEAAAATALAMTTASAPQNPPPQPVEVRVDRPFILAVQHRESGTCLFLGRVTDPR